MKEAADQKEAHNLEIQRRKQKKTGSSDLGTSSRVYSERPQNRETK